MREHFVASSIRSRKVARTQRSSIRQREDALKALDFGNSLLDVHSSQVSLVHLEATHDIPSMESQVVRSGHASTLCFESGGRTVWQECFSMVDEELTGRGDYPLFAILRCPGKGDFPYAELIVQSSYHRGRCIPLPET
jgi:hypothetical protein